MSLRWLNSEIGWRMSVYFYEHLTYEQYICILSNIFLLDIKMED